MEEMELRVGGDQGRSSSQDRVPEKGELHTGRSPETAENHLQIVYRVFINMNMGGRGE